MIFNLSMRNPVRWVAQRWAATAILGIAVPLASDSNQNLGRNSVPVASADQPHFAAAEMRAEAKVIDGVFEWPLATEGPAAVQTTVSVLAQDSDGRVRASHTTRRPADGATDIINMPGDLSGALLPPSCALGGTVETAAGSNAVSVGYLQQSHDAATFTARVDAINPSSVKRGGTVPAVITGVGLAETTELVFSGTGVVATISGPVTDTSVPVLINVFQNEKNAPGDSTPVVLGDRGFTLFAAIGPVTNPPEVVLRIEKSGNTFGQSQPSSTLAEVAGPTSRYGGPVERLSAAVTCRRRGILRTRRPQLASRGLPQAGTRLM